MKPSSHQQNQQRLNAATRANWELFQTHRERLGKLLIESCGSRFKSLCVLGAGNTNDLDLPPLTAQFQRTLLLDLDLAAMQHGVRQQFGENTPNSLEIRHAEVTGSLEVMNELLSEPTKEPLLQQLTERLSQPRLPITIGEQFDCVVSSCLLSQLIESVKQTLGESHLQFVSFVQQIRLQHLRTLAELTASGGVVVLVIDFVSSATVPQLATVDAQALPALARQLIAERNFFTGLNPAAVAQAMSQPPLHNTWAQTPQLTTPWLWNLGPRSYLVTALVAKKR